MSWRIRFDLAALSRQQECNVAMCEWALQKRFLVPVTVDSPSFPGKALVRSFEDESTKILF